MDIQKIINTVVAKLKADPSLVKKFLADPAKILKSVFNIDVPADKINAVVEGVKGQIDLPKGGILAFFKKLFGMK